MNEDDVPPCTRISQRTGPDDQPPHASWDLDVGDGVTWLRALQICQEHCPFVGWCIQERADHRQLQHRNPQDVIWAGVAYNAVGEPMTLSDLRLRATVVARRRARQRLTADGQAAG